MQPFHQRLAAYTVLLLAGAPALAQQPAPMVFDERPFLRSELPAAVGRGGAELPASSRDTGGSDDGVLLRIVGGHAAPPGKWPSMIALYVRLPGRQPAFNCGGTIIDSEWVLTAAHCMFHDLPDGKGQAVWKPEALLIREGTTNLEAGGRAVNVRQVIVHENYDDNTKLNDVALLRLEGAANAPRQQMVGRGAMSTLLLPGVMATTMGFGKVKPIPIQAPANFNSGPSSQHLLQVDVPIVSKEKCKTRYKDVTTDATMCAGRDEGGADTCPGDSGGPIYVRDKVGQALQAGVVSYGAGCAQPNAWGVYASVGHYEDWIKKHVPNAVFGGTAAAKPPASETAAADTALETMAAPQAAIAPSQSGQVSVDIAQGVRIRVGTPITVRVTSSIAGQLLVLSRDAKGDTVQLFPNGRSEGTRPGQASRIIPAGGAVRLPGAVDGFELRASEPAGVNEIIAVVLPPGVNIEDLTKANEGFRKLPSAAATLRSIALRTRDLALVQRDAAAFAIGRRTFEIVGP